MKLIKFLAIAGMCLSAYNVCAQSAVELIKARAAEINELKSLLNNPDPTIRLAALDVMQNSSDKAMREVAYSAGINASDESMVALTVRNKFREIKNFSIALSLPADASENAQKKFAEYGSQMVVEISKYDYETSTIEANTNIGSTKKESTITNSIIHLSTSYCNGKLVLDDQLLFSGQLTCEKQTFNASTQLF